MRSIKLSQGYFALVSNKDYVRCMQGYAWHVDKRKDRTTIYAKRMSYEGKGKSHTEQLHRFILGVTDPTIKVDHKDGNGLNNMRSNLRQATHAENLQNRGKQINNTSGYKGVTWHKQRGKWAAQLSYKGKHVSLGLHLTAKAAALAHDAAAKRLFGRFARTNF